MNSRVGSNPTPSVAREREVAVATLAGAHERPRAPREGRNCDLTLARDGTTT